MADNVGYTPGTGATVAADDIAGVLHQRVKISLGADGSAVDAPGDGTNGMLVEISNASVPIGDGTNILTVDTDPADGEPNSGNALHVEGRTYVYNGSTWDRARGHATVSDVGQFTSAQTGTALWTPGSGRAICVTAIQIQSFGTTAGTCIVWFGASGDTTYTRGTDLAVFDGEFAPSSTNKPGIFVTFPFPLRGAVDHVVRLTTTNAQSVTVNVMGYEL